MNEELAKSLRDMQANPSTGTAHNKQLISTQIETIFAIDQLKEQIEKLNKTIESNEKQNLQLERSNLKLQQSLLILTAIGTGIACFQFLLPIVNTLFSLFIKIFNIKFLIPFSLIAFISGIIAAVLAWGISLMVYKYEKRIINTYEQGDRIITVTTIKDILGRVKSVEHEENIKS